MAGDLRLVAALLHLIKHVERMGDQCVNVAKLIPLTGHEPPVRDEILTKVVQMGQAARAEVVQCKRAFAERDVAMAEDLVERDRDVNRLNREVFRLAVEVGDDADTREWAMTMIARGARLRARRRQRRRHRRADRVRGDRAVPRVHDASHGGRR